MVGWLYINDEVAAPLRMLEDDVRTGLLTLEIAARFVPILATLRGKTFVEYKSWQQRRVIRCLGAEHVGSALMIEAVDVGPASIQQHQADNTLGPPEDWLTINNHAYCRVTQLLTSDREHNGHCLFHVALPDWRDLRIGEDAPLAAIGITYPSAHDNDGSITPLLHSARETPLNTIAPKIEIVRLRERERLTIHPFATDWGDATTLVVARLADRGPLHSAVQKEAVTAG